jgi:hypothetical protein
MAERQTKAINVNESEKSLKQHRSRPDLEDGEHGLKVRIERRSHRRLGPVAANLHREVEPVAEQLHPQQREPVRNRQSMTIPIKTGGY